MCVRNIGACRCQIAKNRLSWLKILKHVCDIGNEARWYQGPTSKEAGSEEKQDGLWKVCNKSKHVVKHAAQTPQNTYQILSTRLHFVRTSSVLRPRSVQTSSNLPWAIPCISWSCAKNARARRRHRSQSRQRKMLRRTARLDRQKMKIDEGAGEQVKVALKLSTKELFCTWSFLQANAEPNHIRCPHCAFEIDPRHLQRSGGPDFASWAGSKFFWLSVFYGPHPSSSP